MHRRNFISSSCKLCLISAAGFALPQLSGCAPSLPVYKTTVNNNAVSIPLTMFDKSATQIIRTKNSFYDIAVTRNENNTYNALLLMCTHQENQLSLTGSGYYCSLHGSTFDKEGNVKKGPAEKHLEQYSTTIDNDNLIIYLKST